ncbi:MAG TPA: bifunctional UDP-sugar hydrolase/5'-nucleotidase, partial [Blastocatellia bacterium]|nr:bifunctional UDP-sugar hydrolase/5'-nucleotidase [Blastocatellia bacterium]
SLRPLVTCCLVAATVLILIASGAKSDGPPRAHIIILSTTDLHGNIYPIDYNTNTPDSRGLARVATIVKQARSETPNLLLLDSGDTIQGTPLTFHHSKINNTPPDPMMMVMSAMGYDAMAVGNHEYEFGWDVLNKARRDARFPWLSANTYKKGTDQSYFEPFLVKQVSGVRVGILGLTTPAMPSLDDPERYYSKIDVREPVSEARKWVTLLREREHVDLVIIAMHMGLEADVRTGEKYPGQMPNENAAIAIAQQVAGIDVILMGHTHREVHDLYINGVLLAQAEKWGHAVARVDLSLERSEENARWRVVAKSGRTIAVGKEVQADPEILRIAEPYHRETQAWLDQVIGDSAIEMRPGEERFRDTAILDLVHRVQLEAGNADVAMSRSLNAKARIPKGAVTIRNIIGLYEYEASPIVIEVTGKQLKEALEHSARHFGEYKPNTPLADLIDERFPPYTYDVAEGIDYELDISKPIGNRVQNMRFRGKPVELTQKLRLATITFRANGGAGYTMFKGARVISRSSKDLRELIIEWVKRNGHIPAIPTNNWRLLPADAR